MERVWGAMTAGGRGRAAAHLSPVFGPWVLLAGERLVVGSRWTPMVLGKPVLLKDILYEQLNPGDMGGRGLRIN